MIIGSLILASHALSVLSSQEPCKREVEPLAWKATRSFAVGAELRAPDTYEVKIWDSRSEGAPVTLELWRREGPAFSVTLTNVSAERDYLAPSARGQVVAKCPRTSAPESSEILLEAIPETRLPGEARRYFVVRTLLLRPGSRRAVLFEGRSLDMAGALEQIAIARTLSPLGAGREK